MRKPRGTPEPQVFSLLYQWLVNPESYFQTVDSFARSLCTILILRIVASVLLSALSFKLYSSYDKWLSHFKHLLQGHVLELLEVVGLQIHFWKCWNCVKCHNWSCTTYGQRGQLQDWTSKLIPVTRAFTGIVSPEIYFAGLHPVSCAL